MGRTAPRPDQPMRTSFAIALAASTALHAALVFYSPSAPDSRRDSPVPDHAAGVAIVAHLKNTLDSGDARQTKKPAVDGTGAAAAKRKPRMENSMQFYPPEAIARGIEGETILLLRYNPDGTLRDAKIARSSGYAILDQAALRAVRATPRAPEGQREVLFPVTFSLQ